MSSKNLIIYLKKNWYKLYFLLSVLFIVFIYGTIVQRYQVFPYIIIHNAKMAAEDWLNDDNYKHYSRIRPDKFIHPAKFNGKGVTINTSDKTYNGYTLITSMWHDTTGFKLIDMDGKEIYTWHVSYNKSFSSIETDQDANITDWDANIHGSVIYPNGDIVFNFNSRGLVKIDKNSNILWKLKDSYHHSIFKDESGNLWIPGQVTRLSSNIIHPLLRPPYHEDYICIISPNGKVLQRTSILDIIYKSGMEALLLADGTLTTDNPANDITHLNDIELLGSEYANEYPLFNAGDIMVSMRNLNLILILDSLTYQIKWSMTGPYIRQHDPDFTPNGDILVFDNRTDYSGGEILGGSRILKINPLTRNINVAYQGNFEDVFYTSIAGKQQLLPNGNILITEYEGGRVFEVTDRGKIVWTFINRYDEDEVYLVTDAIRLSKSYLTFLDIYDD